MKLWRPGDENGTPTRPKFRFNLSKAAGPLGCGEANTSGC